MSGIPAGQLTAETLELAKSAFAKGPQTGPGLQKAGINVAENLVGINLEAPSKKLFPVYSPLRNRFPRIGSPVGANSVQWRRVTRINSANLWPGVAENTRNTFNTTLTDSQLASFATIGHDDYVGFEALARSKGFEDVRAMAALNLLYSVMISEEKVLLGGNVTNLGAPAGLVGVAVVGGGLLTVGTYIARVSALVLRGFDKAQKAPPLSVAEADGESIPAATAGVVIVGPTDRISLSWTAMRGAVAYNVFVTDAGGAVGTARYLATVTTNRFIITTTAPGPNQLGNTTDLTGFAQEFNGVIGQIEVNNGTLFVSKDNGTLTSDGAAGITEFDNILFQMWDQYRLGPTCILCNAQQAKDVTAKIGGSTPLSMRIVLQDGQRNIVGGIYVGAYLNKFASSFAEGFPNEIPIKIHPNLPPGTILFIVESLPYPNNQVPNVWEVETLQEYTQYEWALTARRYEFGIYAQEVLKGYFPAAQAAIVCIAPG
jgi:hypothetical protein